MYTLASGTCCWHPQTLNRKGSWNDQGPAHRFAGADRDRMRPMPPVRPGLPRVHRKQRLIGGTGRDRAGGGTVTESAHVTSRRGVAQAEPGAGAPRRRCRAGMARELADGIWALGIIDERVSRSAIV